MLQVVCVGYLFGLTDYNKLLKQPEIELVAVCFEFYITSVIAEMLSHAQFTCFLVFW